MPADAGNAAGGFSAQAERRWQAIDPLLPVPGGQLAGCGARLIVAGAGDEPAATGTCEHHQGSPESRLHHEIEAAGVAVTLLHYAQINPLSAPFWSQQGYRPLWTAYEARPARIFR